MSERVSKVFPGHQVGRTIGFPTLNLDPSCIPSHTRQGVYASLVTADDSEYQGALYLGPRLVFDEVETVLEIHLLHFNGDLYGKTVSFTLEQWIRGVMDVPDLKALKDQLYTDVQAVRKYFQTP